jgi:hypothetical protein
MLNMSNFKSKLPGYIAYILLLLLTCLWTFWGVGELYYEGWWGAWYNRLPYLVPGAVFLALTLITLKWSQIGGWLMIIIGGGLFLWWLAVRQFNLEGLLMAFMLGGFAVLIGVLFLFEARRQKSLKEAGWVPNSRWFFRNLRYIFAVGLPILITIAISIYWLPIILTRVDDGYRGESLIEGNGVMLIWAPAGPGWSQGIGPSREAGTLLPGANLSWDDIAFYGVPPVGFGTKPGLEDVNATIEDMNTTGLCCYLSEDGLTIVDEPQYVWRMPTVDEIVRSLVRHGQNAGCTWDGQSDKAECQILPDKETPLWIPDWSPIYYWAADEYDESEAYYISYNGQIISHQSKSWGNPRHGYRFVREP